MSQSFFSGMMLPRACSGTHACCPGMALCQVQHTLWVHASSLVQVHPQVCALVATSAWHKCVHLSLHLCTCRHKCMAQVCALVPALVCALVPALVHLSPQVHKQVCALVPALVHLSPQVHKQVNALVPVLVHLSGAKPQLFYNSWPPVRTCPLKA